MYLSLILDGGPTALPVQLLALPVHSGRCQSAMGCSANPDRSMLFLTRRMRCRSIAP